MARTPKTPKSKDISGRVDKAADDKIIRGGKRSGGGKRC